MTTRLPTRAGDATVRSWLYAPSAAAVIAAVAILFAPRPCIAQEQAPADTGASVAVEIVKKTVLNPASYVPSTFLYVSSRLDWASSQQFFQNGSMEFNGRYTISGLPSDVPLTDTNGKRKILTDALENLPLSFANNALSVVAERALTHFDPEHSRRWAVLARIERIGVACLLSYALSIHHFEQWRRNERLAAQLGY